MQDLTKRQTEVLDFIKNFIMRMGMPPTYREIGDSLGIKSTNGVSEHVNMLVRKGYIERPEKGKGLARGLLLTNKADVQLEQDVINVPILGNVAAGAPILAEEHIQDVLKLDQSITKGSQRVFALRVRGESMINEGILEGDLVIVRQQKEVDDGDIVVALIDGEATVKTFFRERSRIRLQPANDLMKPIYVDNTTDSGICGKVIGVYRTY